MEQANTDSSRPTADNLLTRREVERRTGLKKSAIYAMMGAGRIPRPVRIGAKAVRWRESEINAWIAGLPLAETGMGGRLET